jgi:hypothetical protein
MARDAGRFRTCDGDDLARRRSGEEEELVELV